MIWKAPGSMSFSTTIKRNSLPPSLKPQAMALAPESTPASAAERALRRLEIRLLIAFRDAAFLPVMLPQRE